MGFPERHLGADEHVVMHLRTHPKKLGVPVLVLLLSAGLGGYLWGVLGEGSASDVLRWVVLGAAVLAVLLWSLLPFLAWLTTTYTVTTERLITRSGLLTRRGRDIPLRRVNDVAYEQGMADRLVRAGTLVVSAASEQGQVVLHDVPGIVQVQLRLLELVRDAHEDEPTARE